MKIGTLFHKASHATLGRVQTGDDAELSHHANADVGVYEGEFDPKHYFVAGTALLERVEVTMVVTPANPVDGDTLTVTGLPADCWVRHSGGLHQVIGGTLTLPAKAGEMGLELVGEYSGSVTVQVGTAGDVALAADPRWHAIRTATPAQIETWLTANVTNLVQAHEVLKVLILAVRRLGA